MKGVEKKIERKLVGMKKQKEHERNLRRWFYVEEGEKGLLRG